MNTLRALAPLGEAIGAAWPVVLAAIVASICHTYFITVKGGVPTIFKIPFDLYLGLACLVDGTFLHPNAWILRAGFGFVGYFLSSTTANRTTIFFRQRKAERLLGIERMFWRMTVGFRDEEPTEAAWDAHEVETRKARSVQTTLGVDFGVILPDLDTIEISKERRAKIFAKADARAIREIKRAKTLQRAGADVAVDVHGHSVTAPERPVRVVGTPVSLDPKSEEKP